MANPNRKSAPPAHGHCLPIFHSTDQQMLQKFLECPICKQIAKPPIFTCQNDKHLFCEECSTSKSVKTAIAAPQCPICKTPISDIRNVFIEQCMAEVVLPCKFKEDGCQMSLKETEYRTHLLACPYRKIQCFLCNNANAEWIGFKEFFKHLRTTHSDKVNGIENANRHIVEFWIEGDSADAARWPPYFFTCFNNVFLWTAISTTHGMWEWAYILADEEEASRFQVIANIISTDKKTELRWKGTIHPIGRPIDEIAKSGLCFVTNSKEMRNPYIFNKKDNPRHYWRTDVEIIEIKPPKPGAAPYIQTTETLKAQFSGPKKLVNTGTSITVLVGNEGAESKSLDKEMAKSVIPNADPQGNVNPPPESSQDHEKHSVQRLSIEMVHPDDPKISDTGNQNEAPPVPKPKPRQRSVKILESEPLLVVRRKTLGEMGIADEDHHLSGESSQPFQIEDAPAPVLEKTYFKISGLQEDRYPHIDKTN